MGQREDLTRKQHSALMTTLSHGAREEIRRLAISHQNVSTQQALDEGAD